MGVSATVVFGSEALAAPWLSEMLDTIAEFGDASIGLVAWELSLPEDALDAAWAQALEVGLIEASRRCSQTSELMFRLAAAALEPID